MKYKFKQITVRDKAGEIELPDGAIIIEAKSSITSVSHGEDYRVWTIHYLEPLIGRQAMKAKSKSVGDIFYEAVINSLKGQQDKLDSRDGKLIKSKANTARVARVVGAGFQAIDDIVGMMVIPAICDFSEIEEEEL